MRENMLSPVLDKLVPPTNSRNRRGTTHYALYEVEIRPNRAVVRMMCTQDKNMPESIKTVYKQSFLPLMRKDFRDDGQYYNTTFASLTIRPDSTKEDFVEMLEKAWRGIKEFEAKLLSKNEIGIDE